jgi:hypothetical protein
MPGQESQTLHERDLRLAATTGTESLAVEVRSQAARLHSRMAQAPVPAANPRNPFSPGAAPRVNARVRASRRRAGRRRLHAPPPAFTLMGIAGGDGTRRPAPTAVIGGEGDDPHGVEGQTIGDRYKVTKIGADAVELEDLQTHGYRRTLR